MERTKRHLPTAALSVLLSLTLAFCMIPAPPSQSKAGRNRVLRKQG